MNSKENTKKNNPKSKKHKHKKKNHYTVLPYFKNAAIYILASMIVFVPLSVGIMSKAVSTVHQAQTVMTKNSNDIVIDNSYEKCSYSEFLNKISVGKLLGTVSCENVCIHEKVYYGTNRACLRNGVGLSQKSYLFGEGGCSQIAGYPSSSFARLSEVKKGDIITVETFWGKFKYEVSTVEVAQIIEKPDADTLILAVNSGKEPFSAQKGEKVYVTAGLISKEVM